MTADENTDQPDRRRPDGAGREPHQVKLRALVPLFLWAVVLFLVFRFFAAAKFVVLGLLGAAALASALRPIAAKMPGPRGLRAILALFGVLLVVSALLVGLGWAMYGPIQQQVNQWPQIVQRANEGLADLSGALGLETEYQVEDIGEIASKALTGGSIAGILPDIANKIVAILLALLVVFIGGMYLLASPPGKITGPALQLLPDDRQSQTEAALEELQPELRWWMIGTGFSMVVVGTLFGLGYWAIGLEFALPLALLGGLAQVVPTFGPLVTLIVSIFIAATQGWYMVLGVSIVYIGVQTVESYFLTPMVMQRAVNIPPIITLFTIIFWGNVFGAAGLILAIPIDLIIWVLLKHHLAEEHHRKTHVAQT